MSPKSKRLVNHIKEVKSREGIIQPFNSKRIEDAIYKALTATGEGKKSKAVELAKKVIRILNRRFKANEIPEVEKIQDIVEEVLILEGYVETAKAYILYREQHRQIREAKIASEEALGLVDNYIKELDWEVKENSNMTYSLQGLNHYVSAHVTKKYWLNRIYPPEIRKAANDGDFHIHNLDILATYCCGWDLFDLIKRGFGGVSGKLQSKPPKHFRTALGQLVNFFYTLQGESAGAQAVSNFDTLLAPFIRYDGLSPSEVKQALQEFLFNCNVPTRVGFQCLSEDTEILTSDGWKNYEEVKEGDTIFTFNIKTKKIENKTVNYVFKKHYQGVMYRLRNQIQDQLISPSHRVVHRKFYSKDYSLEPIEDILKLKSPFIIPLAGENIRPDAPISDEQIKLMAWIISDGAVEQEKKYRSCYRISIYQSPSSNKKNYEEVIGLLKHFKFKYSKYKVSALDGEVVRLRIDVESSKKIHQWFGSKENVHFIPEILTRLSQRQSRLFLETYLKADGFEGYKISITDLEILDGLEMICVNAGYGFIVLKRKPAIGKKDIYILRIIKHPETSIQKVEKVTYKGIIWSVHTQNETVIARRQGKVFITGNTPFTNITLDLTIPKAWQDMPVIIGGVKQKETYGEFQPEVDLLNKILCEVYLEGDASGQVFTFPIPTYNITKDFDWDNKNYDGIWQMTAKYGVPYFSNFINSDMTPEDARSMCCRLRLDNRELYKRGGGLFGSNPLTGSIGVVTINLPRIGYLSKTKKEFFERLGYLMDLAKESLEIKRKTLENLTNKGLYPYARYYLEPVRQLRGSYWGNHFSTIGLIGANEALENFLGTNIGTKDGIQFASEILDFMRERLVKYQEETGNLYNLEATPAEGTSYRLALLDKKKYPDIITAGENEPYYTNSTQLPVNYTDDLFDALRLQDSLQAKYTGGCIEKGNKVLTDKGLIKIEEIVENFDKLKPLKVLSYNSNRGISEWDEVVEAVKINVSKHNKIRIKAEGGLDITTSDWHPFFVLEKIKPNPHCPVCDKMVFNVKGFASHLRYNPDCRIKYDLMPKYRIVEKRADELKEGDYILQNSYNLFPEKESELDNNLMWLIGFFIGDGSITRFIDNRGGHNLEKFIVRFFSEHNEPLERVKRILNTYFNANVEIINDDKRSSILGCVSTSKKEASQFFFSYGFSAGEKTYTVGIPEKVKRNITKENFYFLLSGLMESNGYLSKRDGDLEYNTVSEKLADDILEICSIAGLKISKRLKRTKRKEEADIYRLRIPSYEITRIQDKLDLTFSKSRVKREISNREKRRLPVLRVKKVTKSDVKDEFFYDLTTKNNHNYLAGKNSLVFVHNTVFHAFLGEAISDASAVKSLIRTIFSKFHLPYFTFTPTFSICPEHGYLAGEHFYCPKCVVKQPCIVYSRIVGYLRPVQQWHKGKQEEFRQRKTFKLELNH